MGFNVNNLIVDKDKKVLEKNKVDLDSNIKLTKEEINLILQIIKNSTFSGELIEPLYNLVYKLQESYLRLK